MNPFPRKLHFLEYVQKHTCTDFHLFIIPLGHRSVNRMAWMQGTNLNGKPCLSLLSKTSKLAFPSIMNVGSKPQQSSSIAHLTPSRNQICSYHVFAADISKFLYSHHYLHLTINDTTYKNYHYNKYHYIFLFNVRKADLLLYHY